MMSSFSPIQFVAGLANPGKKYAKSRHNIGSWVVVALAKTASLLFKEDARFQGLLAKLTIDQQKCWLLIPTTYMNCSGRSVKTLARFYQLPPESILVVHDDLDLPPGIARFKYSGGEGGHNGLKDIVTQLGSRDFWRLRIGIGHPGHRDKVHDYVLSPPPLVEQQKIEQAITHTLALLLPFIQGGATGARQRAIQTLHDFKPEEKK